MDEPICAKCEFCKVLYIPPCKCFKKITEVCGGFKNAYICTEGSLDGDEVMWLGTNKEKCEMFTEKESK